jgi:basic membrane protein A
VSYTDADKCLLTSAEKHIAFSVKTAITDMVKNTWPTSGLVTFDASNAGVGISPFHNYDSQVPADVKTMVADALKKLADGSLQTGYTG